MSTADRIRSLSRSRYKKNVSPHQPLNIASTCEFEGRLSLEACARFVESKLHLISRYKQRAVFPPFNLGLPNMGAGPPLRHPQSRS